MRRKGERKREKRKSVLQRLELVGPRSKSVYSTRSTLQDVGILSTLVYFYPKVLFVKYGNVACFDPTHWSNFSTDFRLGKIGNLDSGPSWKL